MFNQFLYDFFYYKKSLLLENMTQITEAFLNTLKHKNIRKYEESGVFQKVPKRIIVIGDLHGDWNATLYVLKASKAIAVVISKIKWNKMGVEWW